MSQYEPLSKSSATMTARRLEANAADLRRCADALDQAAGNYRAGAYTTAQNWANAAFRQMGGFTQDWYKIRMKHRYRNAPKQLRQLLHRPAPWENQT